MNNRDRRIARSRLLRREGKTYNEIRRVIGPVDNSTLRVWLRGIPRPPETHRTYRRDDLRQECRRLRAQGLTISQIAEKTGASKGSVSPWVCDVALPPDVKQLRSARNEEARRQAGDSNRRRAAERRERLRREAAAAFGETSDRDLYSDVDVLRTFLAWLELLGVSSSDLRFRLSIHESADVDSSERWWSEQLGFPLERLAPTVLKRHKPVTVRRNVGDGYHGCLRVRVARSGALYGAVEGWWSAIAGRAEP